MSHNQLLTETAQSTKKNSKHLRSPLFPIKNGAPPAAQQNISNFPAAPCKNLFLNLSRTGGISVYRFRLPSGEGLHTTADCQSRSQNVGSKNTTFYTSTAGKQTLFPGFILAQRSYPQQGLSARRTFVFNGFKRSFQAPNHSTEALV